jgi:iron complex outermembrane recepter protein
VDVSDVAGRQTASRMDVPDNELPVQVSTISQQVLEQQGANDLVNALRNVSGVSAERFYGVYEYYTIRGFMSSDTPYDLLLVDGMRLEGNRFNTQLNNVESVEVLKGPASVLYGAGALGGVINITRKKPQYQRAYDFLYRGGRFNSHQVAGGATGGVFNLRSLLYRVDASFDDSEAWRGAGGRRLNVSPSLTWLINENNRVTVNQAFNRDHFNGDGGLPVDVINLPHFDLSRRFSTPYDFVRDDDSQSQVLLNSVLSPSWQFRDGFSYRRTSDHYFVTEGLSYNAEDYAIDRYALFFHHHRRPLLNQADLEGRFHFLGMNHTVLVGYEFENYYSYSESTADGGDFFPTSISLATYQETQPPITAFPIARVTYFTNRTNAAYWQDQISVTKNLKVNIGGRYDNYDRVTRRDPWANGAPIGRGPDSKLNENSYTYRAGLVYSLAASQQLYFVSSSSFQPVTIIPASGKPLDPETGRSYEAGYRWQGLNGRIQTNLAFYKIFRDNVVIGRGMGLYDQAGQQSSKGIDLDINADLGHGIRALVNYGYTFARFDNYTTFDDDGNPVNLAGNRPRYTPAHTGNLWLTKNWKSGFTAGVGMRYFGPIFTNNGDTIRLGGWTTFSGLASYRHGFWELSLNAENLLNRERYFLGSDYSDQVYPGAPINGFASVRFRFLR